MLMLDTFRTQKIKGYTLVELLVTLLIVALGIGIVAPSFQNQYQVWSTTSLIRTLNGQLMTLPLMAKAMQQSLNITSLDQLSGEFSVVSVTNDIHVLRNGFCVGGAIELNYGKDIRKFQVTAPYCRLKEIQ